MFIEEAKFILDYEEFVERLNNSEKQDKQTILFMVKGIVALQEKFEIDIEKKLSNLSMRNPKIFQIFVSLHEKYSMIKKTKEENSKFLFRKSFKFIKKGLEEKKKGMLKRNIKKIYIDTYFDSKKDTSLKKSPSTRKINQKYLKTLFSNENYFREFENFLRNYDNFVENENTRKILKISNHLHSLLLDDRVDDFSKIQHFPWLNCWLLTCKTMGEDILREVKCAKNRQTIA